MVHASSALASTYGAGGLAKRYPTLVAATSIDAAAKAKVEQLLTEKKETRRYELEKVRGGWDLRAPAGQISFETKVPTGLVYGRLMPVHVIILVNGKMYRREICYYTVHIYDKTLVASHDLTPEQPLTAGDVRLEERELTDTQREVFQKPQDLIGNVVNRIVREGTPLTKSMVRGPIIVESGHPVVIVARRNGIEARANGVALSRGRQGDRIRVRTANKKPIMAKVIDADTVEVGG